MNLAFFPLKSVLRDNSKWIALALIIFFLGFFFFFAGGDKSADEEPSRISREMMESMEIMSELILNSEPFYAALFIFINNFISSFQMLLLGFFFGLSPLITLLANGALLGTVSNHILHSDIPFNYLLLGVLPHGIPELAAFFISAAMGLKMGVHATISPLPGKTRFASFKFIWKEIISILPLIIILLFIAAFVEIYITKNLLEHYFL